MMYINSSSVFVALVTQICDLISRVTAMFETQYVITVVVKKKCKTWLHGSSFDIESLAASNAHNLDTGTFQKQENSF